jgi:hypothetical protein
MRPDAHSGGFETLQSRLQLAVESAQSACGVGREKGALDRFMLKWTRGLQHKLHVPQCIMAYSDIQFFSQSEDHYAVLQAMDELLDE